MRTLIARYFITLWLWPLLANAINIRHDPYVASYAYSTSSEVDIDLLIANESIDSFTECFFGVKECNKVQQAWLDIIPEAANTACERCSAANMYQFSQYTSYLKKTPLEYDYFKRKFFKDEEEFQRFTNAVNGSKLSYPRWFSQHIFFPTEKDVWFKGTYTEAHIDMLIASGGIKKYTDCFLRKPNCDPNLHIVPELVTDVISTACAHCSPAVKYQAKVYNKYLYEESPHEHAEFWQQYDPYGVHRKAYFAAIANAKLAYPRSLVKYISAD